MDENRKRVTLQFLLDTLKQTDRNGDYDIVLPQRTEEHTLVWRCAVEILKSEPPPPYSPPESGVMTFYPQETRESKLAIEIYPLVADVLWQLCLRGFLRPGTRTPIGYSHGSIGEGYSLTLRGREWIKIVLKEDFSALLAAL